MEVLVTKIYEQALDLPIEERLLLINKLLQSANLPTREQKRRTPKQKKSRSGVTDTRLNHVHRPSSIFMLDVRYL